MYEWFPRIVYTHEVKPRSHSARKALHAESRPPGLRFQEFWGEGAGAVPEPTMQHEPYACVNRKGVWRDCTLFADATLLSQWTQCGSPTTPPV